MQAAPMNTQCPRCRSVFRITQAQLDAADGRVRCSRCHRVFDARTRLQKELPLADHSSAKETANAAAKPAGQGVLELDLHGPRPGEVSGVLLSDLAEEPPSEGGKPRSFGWIALWAAANAVLLVALCGQLIFVQRDAFAQDPTMRPLIARMYTLAGCQMPARRAVERIELVRRNVYAHPNVDDALIIDAKFINNADFPQPYPIVTVSLGDIRGKPLIRRNFSPQAYRPELDPNARIAPGSPVQISLEVFDPGREARTFQIGFS
jgi:predicted Zn finger-like uncharacterized protein